MVTSPSRPAPAPANPAVRLAQGWDRFWFRPADPTVLGLIRICCGLVVLYVHLAYSFDLQAFFGEHAWFNRQVADQFRKETPWIPPQLGWEPYDQGRGDPAQTEEEQKRNRAYYERWLVSPKLTYDQGYYVWSIWYHVTDPTWMAVTHTTILAIMFLFTIGFCTRITSVLTWLGALCYIQRSQTTLFGMDTIMNVVLLYLMIGPCGAALSVDRLLARYGRVRRALRQHRPAPELTGPAPSVSANLALRLLQVHFCIIYLASGTSKLLGSAWWNGTAVWGTLANYEFCPLRYQLYYNALYFLSEHRWLWELVMSGGVAFTLFLEISFGYLVWYRPLRWVMIVGAVLLHTGITVFMGLATFSLMMITMLIAFVPPEDLRRLLETLGRGAPHFRLGFNGRARGQQRAASVVRALDAWDQIELREPLAGRRSRPAREPLTADQDGEPTRFDLASGDASGLQLTTSMGTVFTGYALFERLVRGLRLLWPLAWVTWIPGVAGIGKAWFPGTQHQTAALPREKVTVG